VIEQHGDGCGSGVPPVGTRVVVLGSIGGSWCQYTLLSSKTLVPVPEQVSNQNACQFFVNPMSALLMTTLFLTPQPGEYILQTGANSVLGRVVIQLSKVYGFKTINLIRSQNQVADLLKFGADHVICTSTENVGDRVNEITANQGVKYAIDCVGGEGTSEVLKAMAFRGKVLIFGQLAKENISVPSGLFVVKMLTVQGFWLTDWAKVAPAEEKGKFFSKLMELFVTKKIDCGVDGEYNFKDFKDAINAATQPGKSGKVLINF